MKLSKFLLFLVIFVALFSVNQQSIKSAALVNNVGTTSQDSLVFNILNLAPSGNPAKKLDSAYFAVFKSNTNDVIFRDSGLGVAMTGVDSFVIGGDVCYYYHRAVADIDGAGANGIYSYNFLSVYGDSTARTPTLGSFHILPYDPSLMVDSALWANITDVISKLDTLFMMEGYSDSGFTYVSKSTLIDTFIIGYIRAAGVRDTVGYTVIYYSDTTTVAKTAVDSSHSFRGSP